MGTVENSEVVSTNAQVQGAFGRYSKVKRMSIKNFKNLGEVDIDFTKSPIIALKGDNEAGKSSIIDAFAVAVYNAFEVHQKDFIKLGTNGFGVMVELEDGTKVTRIKKANLNYYEVRRPDGSVWNTDKIIKGEGIPSEVVDVMGCIKEPETKEFLHIRTYNDSMMFITTPNSVNYKVMYDALKIEQISKAIKKGSTEANELKNWLNTASIQRETLMSTLGSIKILDIEPLTACRDRLLAKRDTIASMERMLEYLKKRDDASRKLGVYKAVSEAKPVDVKLSMLLSNVGRVQSKISELGVGVSGLREVEKLKPIDISILQSMEKVMQIANSIAGEREICERVKSELDGSDYIDLSILNKLEIAINIHKTLGEQLESAKKLKQLVSDLQEKMKAMGAKVVTCDKCGNNIIIDLNNPEGGVEHCE